MTSTCILSHDNALILLEFEIIHEEGSSNIAIIKKIVLVTQSLQLKSTAKPTNKESSYAPLKSASLELALNIDVKQLKKSQASCWKSIPKTFGWNLSIDVKARNKRHKS